MVIWKSILVLANSVKKAPGRCVAGREVVRNGDRYVPGPWIRPVSPDGEGAEGELLPVRHCQLSDGGMPAVLDIVEVPLQRQRTDPGQPENWEVVPNTPWRLVESISPQRIERIVEQPRDLWLDPGGKRDRIAVRVHGARPTSPSLTLIRPSRLTVCRESPTRATGCFQYAGLLYTLRITDDAFNARHAAADVAHGQFRPPPFGDNCLLCVSLSSPFRGYSDAEPHHYKLIASIIPLK